MPLARQPLLRCPAMSASAPSERHTQHASTQPGRPWCGHSRSVLLPVGFIHPLDVLGADDLAVPAVAAAQAAARLKVEAQCRSMGAIYANSNFCVWQIDFCGVGWRCHRAGGAARALAAALRPEHPQALQPGLLRHAAGIAAAPNVWPPTAWPAKARRCTRPRWRRGSGPSRRTCGWQSHRPPKRVGVAEPLPSLSD